MATYKQAKRLLRVTTPLGADKLIIVGFSGQEAMSNLFHFHLDLLAEKADEIPFESLMGQKITVELQMAADGPVRYFSGIVNRFGQGEQDKTFTTYHAEMVPQFWFLTRIAQSRIFQQITVPDILAKVLKGLDVKFQLTARYEPRDYCVQYRESDFNFASRLMEEEGIFYFFEHTSGGHKLVVADNPQTHPDIPETSTVIFDNAEGGNRSETRIYDWNKVQELRSGKYTLWDHCFELPHKHLEAEKLIQDSVQAGTVTHKLKVSANSKLELYDFPGEYAQRFDGVNPGGGARDSDPQKIFTENARTVAIRMQQEAMPALRIEGASTVADLVPGHKFTLQRHYNADGAYLLTSVSHSASLDAYRSEAGDLSYRNSFTCIPNALPFRPPQITPRPVVQGSQTAVVVGPPGEEIFTDKYCRIKVQFHWDREGKHDASSSCWLRVATPWAGKRWGVVHTPRIGQEVVVDFLEGDPDQPIVIGSVYNAEQMPAYMGQGPDGKHPNDNKLSGIKSSTTKGGVGFNELRFDDTNGKEQIFIHGEQDMDVRVKHDSRELIINDRHQIIGTDKSGKVGDQREMIYRDKHLTIHRNHTEHIGGDMQLLIGGKDGPGKLDIHVKDEKCQLIDKNSHLHVKLNRNEKVDLKQSLTVGTDQHEKVGMNHAVDAGMQIHLKAGMNVVIEAGVQLTLKVGGNFIDINPAGVTIVGTMVMINSGGGAGSGGGASPTDAKDAKDAAPTVPDVADDAVTGYASTPAHH
jgi:type VI secretion system secreted protein VgrG